MEGMVVWKTEDLVKKEMILNYFALSAWPCMVP
jgi:hypothetical protein